MLHLDYPFSKVYRIAVGHMGAARQSIGSEDPSRRQPISVTRRIGWHIRNTNTILCHCGAGKSIHHRGEG